jgi:hypothetical protein
MDSENSHKKSKFWAMHHDRFFGFHFLLTHSSLNHIERSFKDTLKLYFNFKVGNFGNWVPDMEAKSGLGVIEFASQKFFPSEKNFAQIAFGNFRSENFAFSLQKKMSHSEISLNVENVSQK